MILCIHSLISFLAIVVYMLQLQGFQRVFSFPRGLRTTRVSSFHRKTAGSQQKQPIKFSSREERVGGAPITGLQSLFQYAAPSIKLTESERELFNSFEQGAKEMGLNTTMRVAGGWVRDRLLDRPMTADIDVVLEGMTGTQFVKKWRAWVEKHSKEQVSSMFFVKRCVAKSKHLETGKDDIEKSLVITLS